MAEYFRFFNSTEDDIREYPAADFAEYFNRFLSDGLYTENGTAGLKVTSGTGLSVNIAPGYGYIRGYMYHNDATLPKELDAADSILDRIDRIVLRFDEVVREIRVQVKKGDFSSTPQPPEIEVTDSVKEMTLARVRIRKGATSISASDITDDRFLPTCGLVSSLIDIPAKDMWDAWGKELDDIKEEWREWFEGKQDQVGGMIFSGTTEPTEAVTGDYWYKEV